MSLRTPAVNMELSMISQRHRHKSARYVETKSPLFDSMGLRNFAYIYHSMTIGKKQSTLKIIFPNDFLKT